MKTRSSFAVALAAGLALAAGSVLAQGGGGGGGSGAPSNNPPSANTNSAGNVAPGGNPPDTTKGQSKPMKMKKPMGKASGAMSATDASMSASAPMQKK